MGELLPGYGTVMTDWLAAVTGGNPPTSATDPLPAQDTVSQPVGPVSPLWWAGFVLLAGALLSWPVWALVRRLRARRGRPAGAVAARWLVVTGLIAALGGIGYAVSTVASSGKQISGDLLGQPLPWLLLRGVAAAALVCTALLVPALRTATGAARVRLAVVAGGGVLLLPFALALSLLLP
jgi:hypothetical protein